MRDNHEIYDNVRIRAHSETDYYQELWSNLSKSDPRLRDMISLEATALYPEDLSARARATRLALLTLTAHNLPVSIATVEDLWELPAIQPNRQLVLF